jgi:hypothetical protein
VNYRKGKERIGRVKQGKQKGIIQGGEKLWWKSEL